MPSSGLLLCVPCSSASWDLNLFRRTLIAYGARRLHVLGPLHLPFQIDTWHLEMLVPQPRCPALASMIVLLGWLVRYRPKTTLGQGNTFDPSLMFESQSPFRPER